MCWRLQEHLNMFKQTQQSWKRFLCGQQCVVMLSQDSFYRGLTKEELADVACKYYML
jgi:hypothetical protein